MKARLNPTPESVLAHHRAASHKGWKGLRKIQTAFSAPCLPDNL